MTNHPEKGVVRTRQRGRGHVTFLNLPPVISSELVQLRNSNFVCWLTQWGY